MLNRLLINQKTVSWLLLLTCFFLSGLAGLIYETVWTQQFSVVFGTSELAVVTVLAAYMAGLAMGAAVSARFVGQLRRPVLVYALLELGIALFALATPAAISLAGAIQAALFGGTQLPPESLQSWLAVYDLLSSMLILIVPTGFMGATLPLLVRHAVHSEAEIGSKTGLLYTVNTIGAAAGTVVAAFWLVPRWGLSGAVWSAVAVNGLVFFAALALTGKAPQAEVPAKPAAGERTRAAYGWILPLIATSGVVSFSCEVLWTRLLSHILGGSVYAFGTMLATFLMGIAGGAALASLWIKTRASALKGFVAAQLGAALCAVGGFIAADYLPAWSAALAAKAQFDLWSTALIAAAVLLPGALCFGFAFPCAVRCLASDVDSAGRASGRVFAWNTLGAIAGSIAAGFFLIPALGFAGTATAAAFTSMGIGLVAVFLSFTRRRGVSYGMPAFSKAGVCFALVVAVMLGGVLWFRPLQTPLTLLKTSALSRQPQTGEVSHMAVGRSATVMLLRQGPDFRLTTNGLPESMILGRASHIGRFAVARWLSLLPMALRPDSRSMMVIGLGAGITADHLPPPLERVDVIELEPEVVRANRLFANHRLRDPLADDRVHVHINDARGALLLTSQRFDAIVSQPSHPWTSAAANLFSREFLELAKAHLNHNGVFIQWIGLNFVNEDLVRAMLATLNATFEHVEVYAPGFGTSLLFAASQSPLFSYENAVVSLERAASQWSEIGIHHPEAIMAARRLDTRGSHQFSVDGGLIRDQKNLLRIHSPRAMAKPISIAELDFLMAPWDALLTRDPQADTVALLLALLKGNHLARARRLAGELTDDSLSNTCLGMIALANGNHNLGTKLLAQVLRSDPGNEAVSAAIVKGYRGAISHRGVSHEVLPLLSPAARIITQGWQLQQQADWQALKALDGQLAAMAPGHTLFTEAAHLRVAWMRASGEAGNLALAHNLLFQILEQSAKVSDLFVHAELAAATGDLEVCLARLNEISQYIHRRGKRLQGSVRAEYAGRALGTLNSFAAEITAGNPVYGELRRHFRGLVGQGTAKSIDGAN